MQFFDFIIWSPNPEIFPNIDWIKVRWYGFLFAMGFIISQQLMYRVFKIEGKSSKDVDSLTLFMIIATIIGARLGHVLFYEPARYLRDPISILKTWEGGLASHGAAIGILTGIWLYANYLIDINPMKGRFIWKKRKREGQSFLWVVDRIVICVAITGALIRFGNFLNAEIIGLPTRSNQGVVFARDVIDNIEYMHEVDKVKVLKDSVTTSDEYGYVPIRIVIDFNSQVSNEQIVSRLINSSIKNILSNYEYVSLHVYEPYNHTINYKVIQKSGKNLQATIHTRGITRHPAQLYESISTFLLFLFLLFLWNRYKEKTPEGLLFSLFLVILFGLRFLYEFLKVNQVDFEDDIPLNMGQWLSIPLVIVGIILLVKVLRKQKKTLV
jgi:prolipoprotein diacylglyceryl transferase